MSQNDAKAELNWNKTNQNKPKRPKGNLNWPQNELKQAKTSQKET